MSRLFRRVVLSIVSCLLALPSLVAADRLAEFEKLDSEYKAVEKKFFAADAPADETTAESIRRYEAWLGWQYIPKFVALAEAQPDDEAAFRACQWIIDRTGNVGNEDKLIFDADQRAWQIVATHHSERGDLAKLCLQVSYLGPAQEQFLRGLVARKDLSRENMGFAKIALAELLYRKQQYIEFHMGPQDPGELSQYFKGRWSPGWGKDLIPANAATFKAESKQVFGEVIARYPEVSTMGGSNIKTLGDKARKTLHALEYLGLGSQAQDILGNDLQQQPLKLSKYRGRIVVLSFWFTGCGP